MSSKYTGEKSKKYKSEKDPKREIWYQGKKFLKTADKCRGHYVGNACNC